MLEEVGGENGGGDEAAANVLKTDGGVSELLAADSQRAWIHPGWEDTVHKWCVWLVYMKKKDEKEKWRRCISARWRR